MTRTGCFEIQTNCGTCGQPVAVNAPRQSITCSACQNSERLPEDHLPGFMNELEEAYDGLEEGQGQGGTMMGGGKSYTYGFYRLTPRCAPPCKTPLPKVSPGRDGTISCPKCQAGYQTYPAPEWLRDLVPSAVQVVAPDRENSLSGQEMASANKQVIKPIAMSCPSCSAGLTVTSESERTTECQYCNAQVFIPDELWSRLHPVDEKKEWFVLFDGKNQKQLDYERREREKEEERAELANRSFVKKAGKASRKISLRQMIVIGIAVLIGLSGVVIPVVGGMLGIAVPEATTGVLIAIGVVIGTLGSMGRSLTGARTGPAKACKKALMEFAQKHQLKTWGDDQPAYVGSADGSIQGRDVKIDPSSDHAIEVELNERVFYLKTEPEGYPDEELHRFTTGDARFDTLFPIRYASRDIVRRLKHSSEPLAPFQWFLDRWGDRITQMEVRYDIELHITPGGAETDGGRYLLPEDIEPLVMDTLTLAKGLDAVARGKQFQPPDVFTQGQSQSFGLHQPSA